ncbi:MAG: hypothetical protein QOF81_1795, partial [Acidimicrobiaceae bacterium]|nr:hypothetical protein [Acidimicrobiaceae bacterium]
SSTGGAPRRRTRSGAGGRCTGPCETNWSNCAAPPCTSCWPAISTPVAAPVVVALVLCPAPRRAMVRRAVVRRAGRWLGRCRCRTPRCEVLVRCEARHPERRATGGTAKRPHRPSAAPLVADSGPLLAETHRPPTPTANKGHRRPDQTAPSPRRRALSWRQPILAVGRAAGRPGA